MLPTSEKRASASFVAPLAPLPFAQARPLHEIKKAFFDRVSVCFKRDVPVAQLCLSRENKHRRLRMQTAREGKIALHGHFQSESEIKKPKRAKGLKKKQCRHVCRKKFFSAAQTTHSLW